VLKRFSRSSGQRGAALREDGFEEARQMQWCDALAIRTFKKFAKAKGIQSPSFSGQAKKLRQFVFAIEKYSYVFHEESRLRSA
jgi:hypothetical protein